MREGHLFVIEGIDGSGKSSTAAEVVRMLREVGYSVAALREPTYESEAGKTVRAYLDNNEEIPGNDLINLFIADRVWDVQHNIKPALDAGNIVVMDRYFLSNSVYECSGEYPWKRLMKMNRSEGFPEPDIWFILDPGVGRAFTRLIDRGSKPSQYETRVELEKHDMLYKEIAAEDLGNYVFIYNGRPIEEVANEIVNEILWHVGNFEQCWHDHWPYSHLLGV
jgi:thymidylate kinase